MKRTLKEIQNEANVKALKKARKLRGLSRKELASRLNVTAKTVEKYENGRGFISEERILKILGALEITHEQFSKVKKGKGLNSMEDREKKVLRNSDRRSYQKNITKECKVLRSMRRMKKISQDDASRLCGYSRATIGHIENGRIELSRERARLIVKSYGYRFYEYEENLTKEELRDSIIDTCIEKIDQLDDSKLVVLRNLIMSF